MECQGAEVTGPWLEHALLDERLRDVIEDEALVGQHGGKLGGGAELSGHEQEIVGQAERRQGSDAAQHVGLEQELVIRLALDQVAHATKVPVGGKVREAIADLRRAEVDPSHDATDEGVVAGQIEQKLRLALRLVGLDGHAAVDAIGGEQRAEVGGEEVLAQHRHAVVDPGVTHRIVLPEVLVCIDSEHQALGVPG